jgi:hypothetical protein
MPNKANADATRANDLIESEAARVANPSTAMEEPKRPKLRSDSELPKVTSSMTDSANTEPNLGKPRTDRADATRQKLRSENEAPIWV